MKADIIYTFERIYGGESDAIFRFCVLRVSDREQALDITQETFLRLWQTLLAEKKISNERAFLFTVAHRLIIDWYRKKKSISLERMLLGTEKESRFDLPDETTIGNPELKAEGRYLLGMVHTLAPAYRDPIYLRFVEGLSPQEIGAILGISANAASVRVRRGILELRKKTGYNDTTK
jgi:RNA polymerase sigma-70 factor (ECF subfamily)